MEFRILGPLEVRSEGGVVPLGGAKQRALLALLLLRANEVVSTDRLIDDLWAEEPPATAAHTLQVYVSNLRKALGADGARLATRPPGYVITLAPDELDLARFERLVGQAREALAAGAPQRASELLGEAIALWRGAALADFAFEPFAQTAIGRLEEMRLAALEERIDADLACGRQAALVGELRALVDLHPLRERLQGQLMLALYRSGRQVEALEAFRAARAALVEGLGIDPSPALQRLERAILVQDPSLELVAPPGEPARERDAPQGPSERSILVVGLDDDGIEPSLRVAELLAGPVSPHGLIVAHLVHGEGLSTGGALGRATAELNERRAELAARGVPMRGAAFTSTDRSVDIVRLAADQDVDLLLLDGARAVVGADRFDGDLVPALEEVSCDVALHFGRSGPAAVSDAGLPVLVPFGGAEHDWASLELGAWLAASLGTSLRLLGTEASAPDGRRDASRLLAHASLAVQQLVGVVTEPVLAAPGEDAVIEAAEGAAIVAVGLSESWRHEGPGAARLAIATGARPPVLLVRRGLRPGGLAPRESLTRFTWSLAGTGANAGPGGAA